MDDDFSSQIQLSMCPEFASEKHQHTADRSHRNYRTSAARMDGGCGPEKNREVVRRDKWDSSNRRTVHLEDRASRCSPRDKKIFFDDTDRMPRTERHRPSLSDYRHEEEHARGNRQSRSRSPGYQKVFRGSDSYRWREGRNNSLARRHSDNFSSGGSVSQERSSHRDRSCRSRLSACTQSMRPAEQDRFVITGTRHSRSEQESRKYQELSHLNDEKACCSKYLCSDVQNFSDNKTSGTRTSHRHSAEQIVNDSSSPKRGYNVSSRGSRNQLHEDVRHCYRLSSGCSDCKDNCQVSSSFSDCRYCDSSDHKQRRSSIVCDGRHGERTDRHDAVSPSYSSRNESSNRNTSYRHRSDEIGKKQSIDRRRSSPHDRCTSVEECVGKQRTDSDSRQSASRGSYHRSESKSTDKANSSSSFKESGSKKQKLNKQVLVPSSVSVEKSSAVVGKHMSESDNHVSSQCSMYKDESSMFQPSRVTYFSERDHSVVMPTTDTAKCPIVTDQVSSSYSQASGKTGAVSSGSEYCVVSSWPGTHGNILLQSAAQPVIHSGQRLLLSGGDPVTGGRLLRPHWPGPAVTVHHAAAASTRLHDLVPTPAVTRLPLSSTRTSAVPMNIDARKLLMSGVSVNSNVRLCTPFNPAVVQPDGGGSVMQYAMDDVYGDSPLLDEPSYSPVAARNSTFSLMGSSVSSVDYVRPELMQSVNNVELQKMLDVVTVAKTTLEQMLPPTCQADPNSLKQQKVMCGYFM